MLTGCSRVLPGAPGCSLNLALTLESTADTCLDATSVPQGYEVVVKEGETVTTVIQTTEVFSNLGP